jgi:hypothetical protein
MAISEHIDTLSELKNHLNDIEQMITDVQICTPHERATVFKLYMHTNNTAFNIIANNASENILALLEDERIKLRSALYNALTKNPIDNSSIYDFVITVDKRHNGSSAFAELWIDTSGHIVASPIIYSHDKVEIVKRGGYWSLSYTTLIELTLADNMNIDMDFISLFNEIYSEN